MRLLLICILAMMPLLANGQSPPAPEKAYEAAFNHIKHDRQLRRMGLNLQDVAVFDSIVHLELLNFNQDIRGLWGFHQDESQLIDSLYRLSLKTFHKPFYSSLTAQLTANSGVKKGSAVILFSRLHNNLLLAEVSRNQEGGTSLDKVRPTFGQSVIYLFVFSPDSQIKRCYSHHLIYN